MMNKYVKRELQKCRVVLPPWNDDTTHIHIPSRTMVQPQLFNAEAMHHISIKDYIINEPSNFTLSADWNGGTKPPEHNMNVKFIETRGKMIKIDGVGVTTNIKWSGWIPQKSFEEN